MSCSHHQCHPQCHVGERLHVHVLDCVSDSGSFLTLRVLFLRKPFTVFLVTFFDLMIEYYSSAFLLIYSDDMNERREISGQNGRLSFDFISRDSSAS